jgi:endonuclease/exonuclease/phosphatase family metal-dependent hydrolase
LRYRKDQNKQFIGHPAKDLVTLRPDFEALITAEKAPLIVVGDLNYEYLDIPAPLDALGDHQMCLVDPFKKQRPLTFEQDWAPRRRFTLDYIFLSRTLASQIVSLRGGFGDFSTVLGVSDHAPLQLTIST